MKNSIAKRLTQNVAILLIIAFVVLFVSAYYSVSQIVKGENEHYAKTVSGIYTDMIISEADGCHLPVNVSFGKEAAFYGDYICSWYRVDYIYMYIPDTQSNTIQYIFVSRKPEKFGELSKDYMIGEKKKYTLTQEELAVWNGKQLYAYKDNTQFEKAVDTLILLKDSFGNKAMVGVAVSTDDIKNTIKQDFLIVTVIILAVFSALIIALYFLIRKKISLPAKRISKGMTDFITDGKRSDVLLNERSFDEFAMISDAFNSMKTDIDSYLDYIGKLNREKERQRTEMDIAANIQKGFLRPEHFAFDNCEINACMKAAKDIGGDLYDYMKLDDDRTLTVIADISGKGITAAMFMAVTLMLIRQFAELGQSPADILKNTNNALSKNNPRMLFATAFVGIYNSRTKKFTYSNAGHNPPYLINGKVNALTDSANTLLGLFDGEEYTETSIKINTGDTVFLYTDGVNEAVNNKNEFFGNERLEKALIKAKELHSENITEFINGEISSFTENAEQSDDITMLTITPKQIAEISLDAEENEFSKIKDIILKSDLSRPLQLELCVAAEECFMNICDYAFKNVESADKTVSFYFEHSDRIIMRFTDSGRPYDPTQVSLNADDYDTDNTVGGLGRLIAFTVADNVNYEYKEQKNILTITKFI